MSGQIILKSNDNQEFSMAIELAKISETIKTMLDDLGIDAESEEANEPIPLPNVNGVILKKVVQWCEQHKSDFQTFAQDDEDSSQPRLDDIPDWDIKFFEVDQAEIFELILAANYLDIKGLLNIGCKVVAKMIQGKSPEEIRKTFNIKNDFTPEEEEQIRKENEWCNEKWKYHFSKRNNEIQIHFEINQSSQVYSISNKNQSINQIHIYTYVHKSWYIFNNQSWPFYKKYGPTYYEKKSPSSGYGVAIATHWRHCHSMLFFIGKVFLNCSYGFLSGARKKLCQNGIKTIGTRSWY